MILRLGSARTVLATASALVVILLTNAAYSLLVGRRQLRADLEGRANLFALASTVPICLAYEAHYASAYYKFRELMRAYIHLEPDVERVLIMNVNGQILLDSRELDEAGSPWEGRASERWIQEPDRLEAVKKLEPTPIRGRNASGQETLEIIVPYLEDWGRHRLSVSYHVSHKNLRPAVVRLVYVTAGQVLLSILASLLVVVALRVRELKQREGELQALVDQRTRDLREAMRLKDEMVSIVAHDFRSPITLIQGYCERLESRAPDPETRREIGIIKDRAQHLASLAADTLTMSRIEAGGLPLDPRHFRIVDLVRALVDARSMGSPCTLSIDAREDDVVVHADPERIHEVVENLVGNAMKYSPAGSDVRVGIWREGTDARISVTDQGPGIAPADLPSLFQKFSRLSAARASRVTGTGLGLYICRSIVEAHSGRIWVESQPGQGSTFQVALPLGEEVSCDARLPHPKAPASGAATRA